MKHYGEASPGLTALWYLFSRSSWLPAEINSSSVEIGSWCINNSNKTEKSKVCWSIKVGKRNRALSKRTHLESREVVSGRAVRTIKKGQDSCIPIKPQQRQVGLFLLWELLFSKPGIVEKISANKACCAESSVVGVTQEPHVCTHTYMYACYRGQFSTIPYVLPLSSFSML